MERRLFLTGLMSIAGAAAVTSIMRPAQAVAGVPDMRSGGILDELDNAVVEPGEDEAGVEPVRHRRRHWNDRYHWGDRYHRRYWRHHRRRRRRAWRRVCRRYWRHGRLRRRCRRVRVWVHW